MNQTKRQARLAGPLFFLASLLMAFGPVVGFTGCAPGSPRRMRPTADVIGEVFQFRLSSPVEPTVAQRFVIAGAIGDPS